MGGPRRSRPGRRRPRRRRARGRIGWSSIIGGVVALLGPPAVALALWFATPEPGPDPATALGRELAAAGLEQELVQCVLRLAADDLRRGPVDEGTRAELVQGCRLARQAFAADDAPPPAPDADQPDTLGDDPGLDRMWAACAEGSGEACDRLFQQAPVGSDYETFGLTCGDRPDVLDCADLDADPADDRG